MIKKDKKTYESGQFVSPLIVGTYDTICSIENCYKNPLIQMVKEIGEKIKIIEVGCGTGLMAIPLANLGHTVIGVEPAKAMLDIAKTKNSKVEWVEGLAKDLKKYDADLVIMPGHVAQFHLSQEDWDQALQGINNALKPGGILIFDSRNPTVLFGNKESWVGDSENNPSIFNDPKEGIVHTWTESEWQPKDKTLHYTLYYKFLKHNNIIITSEDILKFRTQEELSHSLVQKGFIVENIFGWWDRSSCYR